MTAKIIETLFVLAFAVYIYVVMNGGFPLKSSMGARVLTGIFVLFIMLVGLDALWSS